MNDYTRREEARWTFIAATLLVVCIAAGVALVFTARGRLVPDSGARARARSSEQRAAAAAACLTQCERLAEEMPIFQAQAKAARLEPEPDPEPKAPLWYRPKKDKDREPDVAIAWPAALVLHRQAKLVLACQHGVDGALGPRAAAAPAWRAVAAVAAVPIPTDSDKATRLEAARRVHVAAAAAPVDTLVEAARDAAAADRAAAARDAQLAAAAFVEEAPPPRLLSREVAISVAVGIAIAALVVSFLSVRAASLRRMLELLPLRAVAEIPPGMQAAAVLRLAAAPNGGEPGLVIGAAVGGLVAAALFRIDADLFVVGVMGGLVLGLVAQQIFRAAAGMSRWRTRALDLAELEKPAIPIVLVLSGVRAGLEAQFVEFFDKLSPADAAAAVEKLAAQAEERILAQADAEVAHSISPTPPDGSVGPFR